MIKLKRSATSGATPTTSQLELGEVAINTYDGKMYIKKNDGSDSIVEIGGDATSSSGLDFTGNLNLEDNVRIVIGDGNDLQIYHDGSHSYIDQGGSGNLIIRNSTDDADINFQSDDGSGGIATYFQLDGSQAQLKVHKNMVFFDNVLAAFGDSSDLQIFHNGSNSVIKDAGTGNLSLQTNDSTINMWNSSAQNYIGQFNANAVTLYHGGNEKFKTTSTGATVTGTLVADGLDLGDDNILNVGTIAVDKVKGDADDNTNITFAGNDVTAFYQGGAEKIRIDADGRFLIGTPYWSLRRGQQA